MSGQFTSLGNLKSITSSQGNYSLRVETTTPSNLYQADGYTLPSGLNANKEYIIAIGIADNPGGTTNIVTQEIVLDLNFDPSNPSEGEVKLNIVVGGQAQSATTVAHVNADDTER